MRIGPQLRAVLKRAEFAENFKVRFEQFRADRSHRDQQRDQRGNARFEKSALLELVSFPTELLATGRFEIHNLKPSVTPFVTLREYLRENGVVLLRFGKFRKQAGLCWGEGPPEL